MLLYVTPPAASPNSNYTSQKNAKVKYGLKVAESLGNNIFVNDMLKSMLNEGTAIKLM